MPRLPALAGAAALLAAACAGGPSAPPPGERVGFAAEDGTALEGEVRGSGTRGVVLAPGFGADRGSWAEFADLLAEEGYLVLAFDFREFGETPGPDLSGAPADVLGAVAALRERGARSVVVIGASMGGTAALVAAARDGVDLDGVVTLSAPAQFLGIEAPPEVVGAVTEPKLFLAAQDDGSAPASAQGFYDVAPPPKRVEIVVGREHGTNLLEGAQAEVVRRLILDFLERNA